MEEKHLKGRREIRINKDLKISFREAGSTQADFMNNLTLDISRSGLFIKTDKAYPLGTELEIRLHLDEVVEPLQFTALVCRIVSDTSDELSGLGIKIKSINTGEQKRYEGFLSLLNYYGWFC